jgi:hypothetical protein
LGAADAAREHRPAQEEGEQPAAEHRRQLRERHLLSQELGHQLGLLGVGRGYRERWVSHIDDRQLETVDREGVVHAGLLVQLGLELHL